MAQNMGIRSLLSKPLSKWITERVAAESKKPEKYQDLTFSRLIAKAKHTAFGEDHGFADIKNYHDFKKAVKISDYEGLRPYIERIISGEKDVTWPGKPIYFAKTSGTTSGTKYIPITKESIPNHINSARNALLAYIYDTGNSKFLDGKLIFLSGSPTLDLSGTIPTGRLSGIVNHHVPSYLRTNQLPSFTTNCIEDWEAKVKKIANETMREDMRLISGIPPWVQMYFDELEGRTTKKMLELFPNFSLFVYGGVNFSPYRKKIYESIGREIDSIETYPASEGFIAYQDRQEEEGLLLLINSGIFFEFIRLDHIHDEKPERISIHDVELGVNYALILNSNAGLWGYNIGDTIKFVSKYPHKIVVTGRIKHFISAFGEHVIGEEVEKAINQTLAAYEGVKLIEFSVAPQVTPTNGLPHHEWYIEFDTPPISFEDFEKDLDQALCKLNSYYNDLISGKILRPLKIINLKRNAFIDYMKENGKLGGQNKVPRLSNDRKIAESLQKYIYK